MSESSRIINNFPSNEPVLSIEIFPPKTEKGIAALKEKLKAYKFYSPEYISVTYGAGGSSRVNTLELAGYIQSELEITAMAHLTCVGHNRNELRQILAEIQGVGIQNIMALRGDPPKGEDQFIPAKNGFRYASDLIQLISREGNACIGCAGYPEGHVECASVEEDIEHLRIKLDAGAEFIVTQFFLDNVYFLRYRDLLRKNGIEAPIIPGILPISNYSQISKFSLMCGCTIPAKVMRGLHGKSDEDQEQFGLDHAQSQVVELLEEGVEGIHLYALNKRKTVQTLAPLVRSS